MAQIREELVLADQFSAAFTKYISGAESAAKSTKELREISQRASAQNKILSASLSAQASAARTAAAQNRSVAAEAKAAAAADNAAAAATRRRMAEMRLQEAETQKLASSTSGLTQTIRNLAGAYLGLQGLKGLVGLSDELVSTTARLDMMNDGLQSTVQLNNMIFQSAMRARGVYTETAAFVAKLGNLAGNAFSSNAELIAFAEQINKQIVLSGASTTEASAAMLQLTQGLSSGALRGEELNSVLEQTPMIAKTIADYMGVTTGQMRELAGEGQVTAEVVKNAMLAASDETNAKFAEMPMTWSQVWTQAQNIATRALQPVLSAINWLANNIQIIGPLVLGAAGAFAVFQIAANWTNIAAAATTAYNFVVGLLSLAYGVLTGNTAAASAATLMFNSALLASPITWVIIGIMLVIAAIYALVAAFNKATGASVSATGIIFGAFYAMGAAIMNMTIIPLQRTFAAFANFIGNLFNNPVAAIKVLFYDMALTVIGYIRSVIQGLEDLVNLIPFVEVNMSSGIDKIYNSITGAKTKAKSSGYKEYVKPWEYKDLSASFSAGYQKGSNFSISDLFGMGDLGDLGDLSGMSANIPAYSGATSLEDLASKAGSTAANTGSTAASAKNIEKSVNMAKEDIKSLVDVAERRYVNRINLTAQTPVITVNGQNTGNTAADRQNLANAIRDILIEQMAAGSVRSTARPVIG